MFGAFVALLIIALLSRFPKPLSNRQFTQGFSLVELTTPCVCERGARAVPHEDFSCQHFRPQRFYTRDKTHSSYALLIQSQSPGSDFGPFAGRLGQLWRIKNWQN